MRLLTAWNQLRHPHRSPRMLQMATTLRWRLRGVVRPWRRRHRLPAPLYISLTSYPARFSTLRPTLQCLLLQRVRPDGVILWVAEDAFPKLPAGVLALRAEGLRIETCRDLRSYTKLVPALRMEPEAFWATADDDCYYGPGWLGELVGAWRPDERVVISRRARRLTFHDGRPDPYRTWKLAEEATPAAPDLMLTGVGGMLYPPHAMHPDALREDLFMAICPGNDDIWFWWMVRRNGWLVRKTAGQNEAVTWRGSQEHALLKANLIEDRNDLYLQAMIERFGLPDTARTASA